MSYTSYGDGGITFVIDTVTHTMEWGHTGDVPDSEATEWHGDRVRWDGGSFRTVGKT